VSTAATSSEATVPNYDRLDAHFRADPYLAKLGAELVGWSGGRATVRWTPTPDDENFAGYVHGGALFSLADLAFSFASNSWGRVSVALTVEIHYLAAPPTGTALVAEGWERSRGRRSASYLIEVRAEDDPGRLVASFHAMVHRTSRWHFGEEAWPEDWRGAY
jgi:acyl-CoA thioesterase